MATEARALVEEPNPEGRETRLLDFLRERLAAQLEMDPRELATDEPLVELGADSLVLVNSIRQIERSFGVRLKVRQFFEELDTLEALARHLAKEAPQAPSPEQTPVVATELAREEPGTAAAPTPGLTRESPRKAPLPPNAAPAQGKGLPSGAEGQLGAVLREQLQLVSRVIGAQIETLGGGAPSAPGYPAAAKSPPTAPGAEATSQALGTAAPAPEPAAPSPTDAAPDADPAPTADGAPRSACARPRSGLAPHQRDYLESFLRTYAERTAGSKRRAEAHQRVAADNRRSTRFRPSTKEAAYPIVASRAQGAWFWDVDGNEYVDLTMGFGSLLFGHRPPFLIEALADQLERGLPVGPQADRSGEVLAWLCEMTGMERAAYCVTGSEAVMMALRLARMTTGRRRVVLFEGSYHGHYDGTQVSAHPDDRSRALPSAPGVPESVAEEAMVLEYGSQETLDWIRTHGRELAAVLVEPLQQHHPGFDPQGFLRALREATAASGTALVFDEVLTGFRMHPAGVAGRFDVWPDLATYGKVLGGGLPISVVAGRAPFLDGIDGGSWSYGDDSYPAAERTFHAGTFRKHPLSVAAAHAVLRELRRRGTALQEELERRTANLAERLEDLFRKRSLPIRVVRFGSLFRFESSADLDLFFLHLLNEGIYVWEGRTCYLSTAHGEAERDAVVERVAAALDRLEHADLLPGRGSARRAAPAPDAGTAQRLIHSYAPTPEQQELWLSEQLEEGLASGLNLGLGLRLRGPFDPEAMRSALERVVERHEGLRTVFTSDGTEARVLPWLEPGFAREDLRDRSEADQEARVQEAVRATGREVFDRERGPLLCMRVLELEDDHHVLLLRLDHLIADGVALGILLEDLTRFYAAARRGERAEVPAGLPFRRYAEWRSRWLESDEAEASRAFWRRYLKGSVGVLDLPFDRPRPRRKSFPGANQVVPLEKGLKDRLAHFCRRHRCTSVMPLLAAYDVLLHRLSGQEDLVVGFPLAARFLDRAEEMIGSCANLGAVRVRVDPAGDFAEHARRVRDTVLDVSEHEGFPLSRLVRPRDGNLKAGVASRLYSVYFNMEPIPSDLDLGCEVQWLPIPIEHSHPDLVFNVVRLGDELLLHVSYNTDLLDDATVKRWVGHYRVLLEHALAEPETPVGALRMLSEEEREALLGQGSGSDGCWLWSRRVHDLVEEQARLQPRAVALEAGDAGLTYAALDERAEWVAEALAARAPEAAADEAPVAAVALADPAERLVATLGVLKAGWAFAWLDPAEPEVSRARAARSVGATLRLERASSEAALEAPARLELEAGGAPAETPTGLRQRRRAEPEDPAWVLLPPDAGTGRPRCLSHAGLSSLFAELSARSGLGGTARILQLGAPGSAASVWQSLWPLAVGARLVPLDPASAAEAPVEGDLFLAETRALSRLAAERSLAEAPPLWLAGETPEPGIRTALERAGATPALVLAGPPECGGAAWVLEEVDSGEGPAVESRRLLSPGPTAELHVLEVSGEPAPIGVAGEIHVGGEALARPRDALADRERWGHDPLDEEWPALLRTGWMGRRRADGRVELLGRAGRFVRLRGFGLDLDAVERALLAHPAVREAAALLRDEGDDAGGASLVVAAAGKLGGTLEPAALAHHLDARLPRLPVIPHVTVATELPRRPDASVDGAALSTPEAGSTLAAPVPPRNELERQLAGLWEDVLGVPSVGVRDGFFDLGGHSLLVVQLARRIRELWDVPLSFGAIASNPTVEALARELRRAVSQEDERVVTLQPEGEAVPLFLIHPIEGSSLAYTGLVRALGARRPVYALEAPGLTAGGTGPESVEALAQTHVEALERARPEGPLHLAGFSFGAMVAFEAARRLRSAGRRVCLLALLDPPPPAGASRSAGQREVDERIDLLFDKLAEAKEGPSLARWTREAGVSSAVPELLDPASSESLRRTLVRHHRAMRTYRPAPYAGPALLLRPARSPAADPEGEPTGWEPFLVGGHGLRVVPGDHFTMLDEAHTSEVAELLARALERAESADEDVEAAPGPLALRCAGSTAS